MNIEEALKRAVAIYKEFKIPNEYFEVEYMLSHILKVDRTYLFINKRENICEEIEESFFAMVDRRTKGEPFQYILKTQEFMDLEFYVDSRVLIPRSDTEVLVENLIEKFKGKNIEFIDIGTGSGAISIALLKYLEDSTGITVDISKDALEVAKINAKKNNVIDRLTFLNNDMLKGFNLDKKVDLIVSNPPYIPSEEILTLESTVKDFEPIISLDGGEDGLDFYREIILNAYKLLKEDGVLAFEVGYNQAEDVKKIMESTFRYKNIEFIKDLSGINRCVIAIKD